MLIDSISVAMGDRGRARINALFPTEIYVRALQANGAPAVGQVVQWTPSGSVSFVIGNPSYRPTSITDANGYARQISVFGGSSLGTGTVTVVPYDSGSGSAVFNMETVADSPILVGGIGPYAPEITVVAASSTIPYGTIFAIVESQSGILSGYGVTYTLVNSPAGTMFTAGGYTQTGLTDGSGFARVPEITVGATPGTFSVKITSTLEPTKAYYSQTIVIGTLGTPAYIEINSGNGQTADINVSFSAALSVKVYDILFNPVNGASVTFTAPASGASCAFSGSNVSNVNTNASGIATTPVPVAGSVVGTYAVNVTCTGTPGVSFTLNNAEPSSPQDRNDCMTFCEV